MKEKDPLEELIQTPDYLKGYKFGYRFGYDDAVNEMKGDFDEGEKKGLATGAKYLFNVVKIMNAWNIREIDAQTAMYRIFKYLRQKIKK